jgi:hypothetical protein
MGRPSVTERIGTAAVSSWKSTAVIRRRLSAGTWTAGALVCATLMRGLGGLAAIAEGVGRVIRAGARQLERAAAGARARANPAAVEAPPAPPRSPVSPADATIVSPAPAFLSALPPPALPPPRPQWGRGPVLPPPRRSDWRTAMIAKRPTGEVKEITPAATPVDLRSDAGTEPHSIS